MVRGKSRWDFRSFRIKNCLEAVLVYNFGDGTKPMLPRNQNDVWGVIAKKHFLVSWLIRWAKKVRCGCCTGWKKKSRSAGRLLCATGTRDSEFKGNKIVVSAISFFLSGWPCCPAVIAIRTLQLVINAVEFAKWIIILFGAMISFPTSMLAFKPSTKYISR